jgi:hypothetical protein
MGNERSSGSSKREAEHVVETAQRHKPSTAPSTTSNCPLDNAPSPLVFSEGTDSKLQRRIRNIVKRIFDKAKDGKFPKSGQYHADTRHNFTDADVAKILYEPDAIYLSSGKSRRLVYRKGGDIVVVEGPPSGGGFVVTAYGPSGVRGDTGAAALGGAPTDRGPPITEAMVTGGTIPASGRPIPPSIKIWPVP